jgi:hypothetical protein
MRVGLSRPTAYAVGYSLPPAPRAELFNEPLTHAADFLMSAVRRHWQTISSR